MKSYRPPPIGTRLLCFGLFCAGLAAMSLTAAMNTELGRSLASTDYGSALQGGAALNVDVLFALIALSAGALFNLGRRGTGVIVALVAALFGLYSVSGVIGFGAKERVAKVRTAEVHQQRIDDAARLQYQAAIEAKKEHLQWLRATLVKAQSEGYSKTYRDALLVQIAQAAGEQVEVKAATVSNAMPDAQAAVLAGVAREAGVSVSVEDVQLVLIGGLALLLVLGKGLAFGLATALWPRREVVEAEASRGEAEGAPMAPSVPLPAEVPPSKPWPQPMRPVDRAAISLTRAREQKVVKDFFGEAIVTTGRGKVKAGAVYLWFAQWVRERGLQPAMSQAQFGRLVSELRLASKVKDSRFVYYSGLARRQAPRLDVTNMEAA